MAVPIYYAVRITTPTQRGPNVERKVLKCADVAHLNDLTHNIAPLEATVETKYLGQGEPIYKAHGPMGRYFHSSEQRLSYEKGLSGHGLYSLDSGPVDNFNYLGEMDADVLWDVKCLPEGEEE